MLIQPLYRHSRHMLGALILAAAAMSANADQFEDTERNKAIVQQAFNAWENGGSVFSNLLAENIRWTIHGSGPVAGTYVGIDSFVEDASRPLISRLSTPLVPEVHAIWAVDDTVIIRFDGSATTTSGAAYANQFVWIFRMQDGLVTEAEAFLDLAAYHRVIANNAPREE